MPIKLPDGVTIMICTICAVYIQNGKEFGQWCPPLPIVLRKLGPVVAVGPVDLTAKLFVG